MGERIQFESIPSLCSSSPLSSSGGISSKLYGGIVNDTISLFLLTLLLLLTIEKWAPFGNFTKCMITEVSRDWRHMK